MRIERLSKTEKAAHALGRAYAKTKHNLKESGGKAKSLAKKHAPVVKSAVKSGFLAGLRFAAAHIKTIPERTPRRKVKKTKARRTKRRR